MATHNTRKLRRATLLGSAAIAMAVVAAGNSTYAQDADTEEDDSLEEVTVTGSRIKRTGITAPQPVTVLDAEALGLQSEVNLANVLNQLPALGSTLTNASSTGFIGTVGISPLDLRRLGTDRTLVLVNGRRHVASRPASAAVDINTIPQELIERVEVLTGGASAIYGADAVTGVVNFVMKDDYEGASLIVQAGDADEGDAFSYTARGIVGSNFADGRGNAVFTFEFADTQGYTGLDRSFTRRGEQFVDNPNDGDTPQNTNDGIPDEILIENRRLNFITAGGIFLDPNTGNRFKAENGQFLPFNLGDQTFPDGSAIGGDGIPEQDIAGSIQGDLQRVLVTGNIRYDLTEDLRFFMDTKYMNATSFALNGTGAFDIFSIGIQDDNAFLTDAQRQFMQDNNITSFSVSRSHQEAERNSRAERELFRGVAGFEGNITETISFDLAYIHGRATNAIQQGNNRINDRFLAGIDAVIDPATGQAVCRSTIDPDAAQGVPDFARNGCVPINILGENAMSQEAIDFAYVNAFVNETVEQNVIMGTLTGDTSELNIELPGGPIQWAVGGEYRDEQAESFPSEVDQLGITFLNIIPPTTGGFDVWEGFAEVVLPVLKGVRFAEELTLDAAVRISDYSTIGSANTWKVGMTWAPVRDVRFRGTYSESVRAPNIGELFGPQSQTFQFFEDPCDTENLDLGSPDREANCRALGVPEGFDQDETRGNIPGTIGGNPNVGEEESTSFSIGMVYTPSWARGLSLTVDYWDIEITDAIDTPLLQNVLDNCVDGSTIDNQFCPLITRDPVNQQITGFELTNQNLAALEASGIDFEINYLLDTESAGLGNLGTVNFRAVGTWLNENTEFPFQVDPDFFDEEHGELGTPEWAVNFNATWNIGKFSLNYELRFIDSMLIVERDELEADPDLQDIVSTGSIFYHDIALFYQMTDEVQLFGGVNNLTQVFPRFGLNGAGTDSAIFDNIGRFFFAGARLQF
ncbi:TonB-dependent receptor plug domain-containing protein [Eilatimonas milleporae]|uniref:TonB-dependent receptor-like protein n=1 Tax=Eilatimonas milleporae TaxID=911205 RepID=A0A3M0C405_9PROT|nr:TonB-dependent receptor [Eilatimonas milleporae]RMB01546.1 TonB-dependent receptor-like protein [Eilatimonas milleporae]